MKRTRFLTEKLLIIVIIGFVTACNVRIPEEEDGFVLVEAEKFDSQTNDSIRKWYTFSDTDQPEVLPDHDPAHLDGASGNSYVEILPDTRTTHDDKLIRSVNFMPEPGQMGVLSYFVKFNNPGKYYVWARIYSTGTEDNGIHVGLNATWPETGQRMQWCEGKNQWTWASKQRTKENHCGEKRLIYLEIDEPGIHRIQFSMREDGTEFDAWCMSKKYEHPGIIVK